MLVTNGPYTETKEHIGGFWVLEAADLNGTLAWRRKAAVACRAPVEVRPILTEDRRKQMNGPVASRGARKTNSPWVIDADAALTLPVALQSFESVSRQGTEIFELVGCFPTIKLEPCRTLNSGERLDSLLDGPTLLQNDSLL